METTTTVSQLASELGRMYREAPKGEAVVMIQLFGIRYASQISAVDGSAKQIVRAAGIPDSYATEVNKGMNLSKYVQIR